MIGIIPYAGTSFSTYEMLKKYRADKAREEGLKPTDPSPYQRLIFGGIAGLLGQGTSFLNLGSGGLWSFMEFNVNSQNSSVSFKHINPN